MANIDKLMQKYGVSEYKEMKFAKKCWTTLYIILFAAIIFVLIALIPRTYEDNPLQVKEVHACSLVFTTPCRVETSDLLQNGKLHPGRGRNDTDIPSPRHEDPQTPDSGVRGKLRRVTAYSEFDTCNNRPCVMASGKLAYIGAIACPRALQLGTEVVIEGITYTCEDRLAPRFDHSFDIWMGEGIEGHEAALAWGVKHLEVTITQ